MQAGVTKQWTIIIIITVLVVAGLGFAAFTLLKRPADSSHQSTDAPSSSSYYERAVAVSTANGAAAGQKVIDDELAKADTPKQKASLYGSKAALAASDAGDNNLSLAIEYALKAEELAPTHETAAFVAEMYRRLGDTAKAISYFELAKSRIDMNSADNATKGDYEYYQGAIKALQS